MRRRIAVLFAAIAMTMAGTMAGTTSAGATGSVPAGAGAAAVNCNHWSGTAPVVKAHHVRVGGGGDVVGAVQLCKEGSCYWAYVVFYDPMPAGHWGQAYLQRFRGGQVIGQWSCDTPPVEPPGGGNGYVEPRQTQCWTKKIYGGGSTDTFRALGYRYYGAHPDTSNPEDWGITTPPAR